MYMFIEIKLDVIKLKKEKLLYIVFMVLLVYYCFFDILIDFMK